MRGNGGGWWSGEREIRSLRLEKRSGSLNARDGVAAMDGDWLIKLIEFQFESSFLLVSSSSSLNQNKPK